MFCTNCGTKMEDSVQTCPGCGAANPSYQQPVVEAPVVAQPAKPVVAQPVETKEVPVLPRENEPLSAWSYFWLKILFAIPVVGFVFLIVFSCSGANVNRRSFARSYWCGLLSLL